MSAPRPHPVAISGTGIVTPLGDEAGAVLEAICARRTAFASPPEFAPAAVSRIADFDATRYANVRGLRLYGRATRLAISAARLALTDSGVESSGLAPERLGVVMGSSSAHLETLLEFDRSVVQHGLQRANPALMPLSLPSAPGAAVALGFGAKAFSMTVGQGGSSSLDALGIGARLVADGRADACLVVGAFAPFPDLVRSASRAGVLAPVEGARAFDGGSRGTILGEGAAAVVLERAERVRARGATPRAIVSAWAATFASGPERLADAIRRACARALADAGAGSGELALVSAAANGDPAADRAEAEALLAALAGAAPRAAVTAVQGSLGETLDAAGLIRSVLALSSLRAGRAPPIDRLGQPAVPGLRYATDPVPVQGAHALVTSRSLTGACSAVVLTAP